MKTLAIVISKNQNSVNKAEIEVIKTRLEYEFMGYNLVVVANLPLEVGITKANECDDAIFYNTTDTNGVIKAHYVDHLSTVFTVNYSIILN